MSVMNSIIASTAANAQGTQPVQQRLNSMQQQQQAVQTAVVSGAVVVQLNANRSGGDKVSSYGAGRQVDSTAQKEKAKESVDKKHTQEKARDGAAIDISA